MSNGTPMFVVKGRKVGTTTWVYLTTEDRLTRHKDKAARYLSRHLADDAARRMERESKGWLFVAQPTMD